MYAFAPFSRRLLAALAFALTLAPTVHAGGRNNFTLDSDAPGIDRMQVIVRGPDLDEPLRYDFVADAGEIAGGFAIPPGKLREIVLLGFAEGDREPVFRGTTLVTVDERLNRPVTIPLTSIESDISFVATIGTYRVWTIREELGNGEGLRFRAGLIDGDGMTVEVPPKELRWDIFDHPRNGVFPCATQELLCVELRPPLRVNADVAACFKDVFCKAPPPRKRSVRPAGPGRVPFLCAHAKRQSLLLGRQSERAARRLDADERSLRRYAADVQSVPRGSVVHCEHAVPIHLGHGRCQADLCHRCQSPHVVLGLAGHRGEAAAEFRT